MSLYYSNYLYKKLRNIDNLCQWVYIGRVLITWSYHGRWLNKTTLDSNESKVENNQHHWYLKVVR